MKDRTSKLDPHAARLDVWFGEEKQTLEWVRSQLAADGLEISLNALSRWWESRQQDLLQERLLGNIASGARKSAEIEAEFGRNAAPELETLIKVFRVLVLQLSTQADVDPKLLDASIAAMKPVLEFAKIGMKQQEIALSTRRLTILEKKEAQAKDTLQNTKLTPMEREQRMREIFAMPA